MKLDPFTLFSLTSIVSGCLFYTFYLIYQLRDGKLKIKGRRYFNKLERY
ncbi:MAG: hypothetical protein AAF551_09245 [Bacteroidota bacterium]